MANGKLKPEMLSTRLASHSRPHSYGPTQYDENCSSVTLMFSLGVCFLFLPKSRVASSSQKTHPEEISSRVSLCSATTEWHCQRARGCLLLVNTEFLKCHCNTGKMLSQKVAKVTESRHCKYQPTQVLINDKNKIYLTKSIIITDNTVYPR